MAGTAAQMIQYRRGVLLRYVKYRNRRLVPASGDTIAGLFFFVERRWYHARTGVALIYGLPVRLVRNLCFFRAIYN
jgi:hypothetical protein